MSYSSSALTPRAGGGGSSSYGVPVHDQLLAKGKLYQQRKEAMKEKTVSEELRHMRNPRLSEEAKKLKREEKIHERFRRLQQQKEEKAFYEQHRREEEDEKTLSRAFKPTITNRARQASARITSSRSVGDALEQQMRRREEKAAQIRLKYMMQDMSEVRDVPAINPVSEKLAARRREKEGLGGMTHIEAMIERDRARRAEMWEKQREKEEEENSHPYPKITLYAANLQREGDAAERLYQESLENEARRVERIQAKLDETRRTASHTPRITALAAQVGRSSGAAGDGNSNEPIEDELMRRHLDAMSHREELIRQQIERERSRRNPAINPVSDTIASRLPKTSRERLLQPKAQYVDANEPNFRPRINPNGGRGRSGSQQQQQQHEDEDQSNNHNNNSGYPTNDGSSWEENRAQQIEQYEARKAEKIRQLREEAERREMAECTFQPSIHSNPNHQEYTNAATANNNNNNYYDTEGTNIIDRSNQWLKRREAKLQAQRMQQQQQAQQQDSSSNNNNNNYYSSSSNQQRHSHSPGARNPSSANINNNNQNIAGVDSFVERLEEGRKRRHEQYTKLYATGSKWTGESTSANAAPHAANYNSYDNNTNDNNDYHHHTSRHHGGAASTSSQSRERSWNNTDVRSLRPPLQEKVSLSILSP